jgi:anti-sigma factor RsiW
VSPQPRAPTPDQLLAMAYADGQLEPGARAAFEQRLAHEPALAAEVTDLRRIALLARALAPPEPQDHEWRRLRADPWHRLLTRGGTLLLVVGLSLELILLLTGTQDRLGAEALLLTGGAGVIGFLLLLTAAWRWRARNLPYDPYVEVQR